MKMSRLAASDVHSRARRGASTRTLRAAGTALALVLALGGSACDPGAPAMQSSHVFHDDLADAPIPPEWVLEGAPKARMKDVAQANDEGLRVALWDCSAGKFNWYFNTDEFVHILEGGVTVTDERGGTRALKPGDVAYFPAGMRSVWHVEKYVKKLAVLRDNEPSLVWRARRKLGELLSSR
jgi:uncharacterized cupin superfamily protein